MIKALLLSGVAWPVMPANVPLPLGPGPFHTLRLDAGDEATLQSHKGELWVFNSGRRYRKTLAQEREARRKASNRKVMNLSDGVQQGPRKPRYGERTSENQTELAVRILGADFNGRTFDGSPFSARPDWLIEALRTGELLPHTRGSTDYVQWTVATKHGPHDVTVGDWIIRREDGSLSVVVEADAFILHNLRESETSHPAWSDRPDKWTERIRAAHPMNSGKHTEYMTAMDMVGNRHSKSELVQLVCWLIQERP